MSEQIVSFTVEISGGEPDSAWETVSGGGGYLDCDSDDDGLSDLVLRGPLTSGRKALCDWITLASRGEDVRKDITVRTLISKDGRTMPGPTSIYRDCTLVSYSFPRFDRRGTGNLYEEVSVKPIRLELA